MGAIKDLLESERGLVAIALIIASTVLFGVGNLTNDQWISFVKWVFAAYVAGKTVSGSVALVANRTSQPSETDKAVSALVPSILPAMLQHLTTPVRDADADMNDIMRRAEAEAVASSPIITPPPAPVATVIPLTPTPKETA